MPKRKPPEETPGARAERERLARQVQSEQERRSDQIRRALSGAQRKVREAQARQDREAERQRLREAEQRAEEQRTRSRAGQNEAAVTEYLRRHPHAPVKDVAFHAIYGGGTVAWEGLHWKTRRNAEAEASRVIARLKNEGTIHQAGWTGGGRPKYEIAPEAPPPDERTMFERFFSGDTAADLPEDKPKRSYGVVESATSDDYAPHIPQRGNRPIVPGITTSSTGDDDDGGDDDNGTNASGGDGRIPW